MAKNNKPKISKITTIKLEHTTKDRLEHLREHKETYNEVINKALNILNICLKNPLLANKILRDIERSKKLDSLVKNPEKILKRKIPQSIQIEQLEDDSENQNKDHF